MRLPTLLLAVGLIAGPLAAADRYMVATRSAPRSTQIRMIRESGEFRSHAVRAFDTVDAFAADLTADEVAALRRSSEVRFVTLTVERYALGDLHPVSDGSPYLTAQTIPPGIPMIHAPELWPFTKGAPINVAVIDTGIDTRHPDLAANYAGGYNTFDQSDDPTDDNGHGTHVAGTIAAVDNNIGVVGVAPEARIWSVKALDRGGVGVDENIVSAVDWVIKKKRAIGGDWIMSLSLGATISSPVEEEAFKRVIAEGVIVVAAAGNRGFSDVEFPAGYPGVIAVGAVDSTAKLAGFSDHGPHLSVVAPGVHVLSTARTGSISSAGVTLPSGTDITAAAITGSSRGEVAASYVACGLGRPEEFPDSVRGKIALIKRGEITFNEKVRNAQAAGALSVVIYNKDESDFKLWTLLRPDCGAIDGCDDPTHPWPVVLAVSNTDGQRLLDDAAQQMDMGSWLDDYMYLNGTSMACPHVSGALALIWSLAPDASPARVRDALIGTAVDLGAPGFDEMYGFGMVNAYAAGVRIAPKRFRARSEPPDFDRRSPP